MGGGGGGGGGLPYAQSPHGAALRRSTSPLRRIMAKYERAVGRGEEAAAAMRSRLPEVEPEEAEAKQAWDAAQARLSEHLEDLASDRTELAARKDDLDRVLAAIALADEADSEQADAEGEPPAAEPEVVASRVWLGRP